MYVCVSHCMQLYLLKCYPDHQNRILHINERAKKWPVKKLIVGETCAVVIGQVESSCTAPLWFCVALGRRSRAAE